MVKKVLVLGMIPFDAGKTNVAIQIANFLKSVGEKVEYFKPISGHNYWYRYSHTKECIKSGQLVSYDAVRARKKIGSQLSPFITNPVHSLFVPASLSRPNRPPFHSLGYTGWDSFLTIQRFSEPKENGIETICLVGRKLIEEQKVIIKPEEVEKLTKGSKIIEIDSFEEAQSFEWDNFERIAARAFEQVANKADTVVIEAFNDTVWPWEKLKHVDVVFVVGPGQMFIFDSEKVRTAAFLMRRSAAPIREVTFARVEDLLKPLAKISLEPAKGIRKTDLARLFTDLNERGQSSVDSKDENNEVQKWTKTLIGT